MPQQSPHAAGHQGAHGTVTDDTWNLTRDHDLWPHDTCAHGTCQGTHGHYLGMLSRTTASVSSLKWAAGLAVQGAKALIIALQSIANCWDP